VLYVNCFHVDTNVLSDPGILRNLLQRCRNSECVIKVSPFVLAEFINEYRKDVERLKQALYIPDDPLYVLLNGMAEGLIDIFVIKDEKLGAEFINEYRKDVERLKQALHMPDDSLYALLNGIAEGYEPVALIIN